MAASQVTFEMRPPGHELDSDEVLFKNAAQGPSDKEAKAQSLIQRHFPKHALPGLNKFGSTNLASTPTSLDHPSMRRTIAGPVDADFQNTFASPAEGTAGPALSRQLARSSWTSRPSLASTSSTSIKSNSSFLSRLAFWKRVDAQAATTLAVPYPRGHEIMQASSSGVSAVSEANLAPAAEAPLADTVHNTEQPGAVVPAESDGSEESEESEEHEVTKALRRFEAALRYDLAASFTSDASTSSIGSYSPPGSESKVDLSKPEPIATTAIVRLFKKAPAKPKKAVSLGAEPSVMPMDKERNHRHEDVMKFLTGKARVTPKFHHKYKLEDLLGDGAYGFVLSARIKNFWGDCIPFEDDDFEDQVAVKFIVKDKIPKERWQIDMTHRNPPLFPYVEGETPKPAPYEIWPFEICILHYLGHPGLVRIAEQFETDNYIVIVTELHGCEWNPETNPRLNPTKNPNLRTLASKIAPADPDASSGDASPMLRLDPAQKKEIASRRRTSCDLFECIDAHTRMDDKVVKHIFAQISLIIFYLNFRNVVHRDLKDENIIIDEYYRIKLIDFGSAAFIPKEGDTANYFTKFNGTAHFASPEIAAGRPYRGPEAEVWALGVLLYTIVFGENPFTTRADILRGEYRFPWEIDAQLGDLIDQMLMYEEKDRFNIQQVILHPWNLEEMTIVARQHYGLYCLLPEYERLQIHRPTGARKVDNKDEVDEEEEPYQAAEEAKA